MHEGGWSVEMVGSGGDGADADDVRFHRPDGTPLPRMHWEGDRLDTDWALDVLR